MTGGEGNDIGHRVGVNRIIGIMIVLSGCIAAAYGRSSDTLLTVREVIIRGNIVTKEYVILREMRLKAGELLTQEAIDRDKNQIYNLGLFNRVDVDYSERDSGAAVVVTVDERWYFFPFPVVGFRYRDIKNLYYGAGVSHQNFRGRNEKLFASVAFGYDRWFTLMYQNPKLTDEGDLFLTASFTLQKMHSLSPDDATYLNTNTSGWLTIGKRIGLHQVVSISGGYEVWQVSEAGLSRTASSSGRDAFFSANVGYRYDTRNIREYATEGIFIQTAIAKNGMGGSAVDLTAFMYDGRLYVPLGGEAGLAFRTMTSLTWGGIVPPYRKAHFGYDDRIRGYFSTRIESENNALGSAELRLPILTPRYYEADFIAIPQFRMLRYGLYFGLFADAGRSWDRNEQGLAGRWLSGAGGGLHFLLPYGLTIRTEAAVNEKGRAEAYIDFDVSF